MDAGDAARPRPDPVTGAQRGFANQGHVEPKRWTQVTWVIERDRSVVLVDGNQRAVVQGDYRDAEGKAGVVAVDSAVTVKAWRFAPASPAE